MAATTATFMAAAAVVAVIAICAAAATAQAPGPSPHPRMGPAPSSYAGPSPAMGPSPASEDCFNYVLNASDCLSYVSTGSNQTVPDKPCCPELAGLLESHPLCLCSLIGSASTYGVNVSRAIALPAICGVPIPSAVVTCAASLSPGGSPAGSPAAGSPTESPAGSSDGSIAAPPSGNHGSSLIVESSTLAGLVVFAISLLTAFL